MSRDFSILSRLKGHFNWCCGKSFVYWFWSMSTLILLFLPVVCSFGKALGLHQVGCEANHCWRQEEVNPSLGGKSAENRSLQGWCVAHFWSRWRLLESPRVQCQHYLIFAQYLDRRRKGSMGRSVAVKLIYPSQSKVYCFGSNSGLI